MNDENEDTAVVRGVEKYTRRDGQNLKPTSRQKKAEVITLMLMGMKPKDVSAETGVNINTVYKIFRDYEQTQYDGVIKDINKNLGSYIASSLKDHLSGLNNIAKIANEESYIRSQNGRDLAELHKQLEHWTVSILSATNALNQSASTSEILLLDDKAKK
jgi:hypothetical protein